MRVLVGRAHRRSRRPLAELDADGRRRLRRLVANASLAVLPTSDIVGKVSSRLAPGNAGVIVTARRGLGIDQTIAVSEVLAARGYAVTPEIDAAEIRNGRHLDEIVYRLSRPSISRVLVIESAGSPEAADQLLEEFHDQAAGQRQVGIKAVPTAGPGGNTGEQAAILLERSRRVSFVSTETSAEPARLLGWIREMRVRGLELPIEISIPGVASTAALRREVPAVAASLGIRDTEIYDPTRLAVELADDHALERLDITGLRLETCNEVEASEDWRQRIYDLAQTVRSA